MKISNEHLIATFKTKGAELISLKKENQEYLWQANPDYWGRHAPVLFPIVGKLKEDTYYYEGQSYHMGQHGFARDKEFKVVAHKDNHIRFSLSSSEETLKIYPFKFQLDITYSLEGKKLSVTYEVKNSDEKNMLFSIGAHPAFNCPIHPLERRSDYILSFEETESLITHKLKDGNFDGETETLVEGNDLRITDHLFDDDALVFKNLRSDAVSLSSPQKRWLTFHFEGFPYLGVWSKNEHSLFVCIEPWYGVADHVAHNQELERKEGILSLDPGKRFECTHRIEIH